MDLSIQDWGAVRLFGRNVVRDFLVVVGGILIALWAEDQWQTRADRQHGKSALTRIANDLAHDIEDISGNLDRARLGPARFLWESLLIETESRYFQERRHGRKNQSINFCNLTGLWGERSGATVP